MGKLKNNSIVVDELDAIMGLVDINVTFEHFDMFSAFVFRDKGGKYVFSTRSSEAANAFADGYLLGKGFNESQIMAAIVEAQS